MLISTPNAKKLSLYYLMLVMLFILPTGSAYASWTEVQKLLAADGADADQFGNSVSISGDYAIVGAYSDDDNGSGSGSAYIFYYNGTSWSQQAKLTASDAAWGDYFGNSVSISGDYAIVGAYANSNAGMYTGSAYIFTRTGTTWSEQEKLIAADATTWNIFGRSVSISGDYAIVGADGDDDNGDDSGAAYIFTRNGTTWSQQDKLLASDGFQDDNFGISVSISGDYAVVGADNNGFGSAYIFTRTGTSWSQQAQLLASDGAAEGKFGYSVSISGDRAVVGAYNHDSHSGSAYIFTRTGTIWSDEVKLTASDGAPEDNFGKSVSLSGDHIIIGAEFDDNIGSNSGSAYIFYYNGTSWNQEANITATDGADYDDFGHSVSISGDHAIIGAIFDDDNGNASGSAYMFGHYSCPSYDLTDDCFISIEDFAKLASQWLQGPQLHHN